MIKNVLTSTPLSLGPEAALPGWCQGPRWQRRKCTSHCRRHSTCSCCRCKLLPAGKPHCTPVWFPPKGRTLRGVIIMEIVVQNYFLLKGSATMNKEFSASLWQLCCFFRSVLLMDLVVPRPPGKYVRLANLLCTCRS